MEISHVVLPLFQPRSERIAFSLTATGFWGVITGLHPHEQPFDDSFCKGPRNCHNGMQHCWLCDWTPDACELEWPDHCDHCDRKPEPPEPVRAPEDQMSLNLLEPTHAAQIESIYSYLDERGNRRRTALFKRELMTLYVMQLL